MRPGRGTGLALAGWTGCGTEVRLETTRPDVRLGQQVHVDGEDGPLMVHSIEHRLHAEGAYENSITCVPRERWGVGGATAGRRGVQMFLGRVSANDDPARRQRVRVTLAEDPDRRPTPWIPALAASAGAGRGTFWLPEVGDTVLLICPGTPEDPFCLGTLRAAGQEADPAWRSGSNEWKALVGRGGTGLLINDRTGAMRLETPRGSFEIDENGRLIVRGKDLDVLMEATAVVRGEREATIDGATVNVGL